MNKFIPNMIFFTVAILCLATGAYFGAIPFLSSLVFWSIAYIIYEFTVNTPGTRGTENNAQQKPWKKFDGKSLENCYELVPLTSKIFLVYFTERNIMGMTFLRYQEFYESSNSRFRNKVFKIKDYIKWYAKQNSGIFSYVYDWAGYNIPGKVFKILLTESHIPDKNQYDEIVEDIIGKIKNYTPKNDPWAFYVIGALKDDCGTVRHEIAHGLYATEPDYHNQMNALIKKYSELYLKFSEKLREAGYHDSVLKDECQAYLSTGIDETYEQFLKTEILYYDEAKMKFEAVYNEWCDRLKILDSLNGKKDWEKNNKNA